MIEADRISWAYGNVPVVRDIALTARPGRVLGVIGPNGSGKTTLLRLLYGALRSREGTIEVDGERLERLGPRSLARRLAVVVQESGGETSLTAGELVLLGRTPHLSTFQRVGDRDREVAAECLRRVGAAHLGQRAFAELSGGERQRVLIARALAQEATHLLLDEPTNHLDIRFQHEVLQLVQGLGTTTVVVLHDLELAARYCDDVVLLGDDGVAARGTVDEVLRPEVLEPVYRIGIQRLEIDDEIHLLFRPRTQQSESRTEHDPASPIDHEEERKSA